MERKYLPFNGIDPAIFFSQVSTAYVEILAGLRRPEQLSRWLGDVAYSDINYKSRRECMARQVFGPNPVRPAVVIRSSKIFPSDDNTYQGVVLMTLCGKIRAVSIRAEEVFDRHRITSLKFI